jgi:hypothetical protein
MLHPPGEFLEKAGSHRSSENVPDVMTQPNGRRASQWETRLKKEPRSTKFFNKFRILLLDSVNLVSTLGIRNMFLRHCRIKNDCAVLSIRQNNPSFVDWVATTTCL